MRRNGSTSTYSGSTWNATVNLYKASVFISSSRRGRGTRRKDGRVYKEGSFHVFLSKKAVKSYLFCLSFVCLRHCTDHLVVVFWVFLAVTEHMDPSVTLPLFTERKRRGPSDMANSHHFLSAPHTPPQSAAGWTKV